MKHTPRSTSRRLTWGARIVALLATLGLFFTLPMVSPDVSAQNFGPTRAEQQTAADALMQQLNTNFGPITLDSVDIDPALGPPPWIAFVPDRDPAAIAAWAELARRITLSNIQNAPPRAVLPAVVTAQDIELPTELGLNDSLETGQFIEGFGTGPGDEPVARITGAFGTPPPPPPEPDCPSVEPDGAIDLANATPVSPDTPVALCGGFIGDGAFGDSSGDTDFYALNEVQEGSTIILDTGSFDPADVIEATLSVYNSDGELIAQGDDLGSTPDQFLEVIAPATDTYYGAVSGLGAPQEDPFDPSSGTGVTFVGEYLVFAIAFPAPPVEPPPAPEPPFTSFGANHLTRLANEDIEGPCISVEDDGSIPLANHVATTVDVFTICEGFIGDGEFGETSGDFDYYAFDALEGELLIADLPPADGRSLDAVIVLFDEFGGVVAVGADPVTNGGFIETEIPSDGRYVLAVFDNLGGPTDPFDSASGTGAAGVGPYVFALARITPEVTDTDVYLVDLEVGDVISAGFSAQPGSFVNVVDPNGRLGQRSPFTATFIYPLANPLRHLGTIGADFVVETSGIHAIILTDGVGLYDGELRVKRAGLSDEPGDDQQILFIDFDGGSFNDAIFDPTVPDDAGTVRTLSPLVDWLPRWGLDASDEDAVIEAIMNEVNDDLFRDYVDLGLNGHRDATGNGGEIDIKILNSRDHADPWGEPNVSRIIVGGSIDEAGIPTIGIAQSIDPGNFETEETAIVLLDLLSAPAGTTGATLNNFPIAEPFSIIDLIGQGVGNITAHEAGHFIGNWHTTAANEVPNIMDEGGNLPVTIGVGPDFIFGTEDDYDNDFVTDEFSFNEGFQGFENSAVRTAQAFSTGQAAVVPFADGLPAQGLSILTNVRSGQVLDADGNGAVNVSNVPRADDQWELMRIGASDLFYLRNDFFGKWLDADPSTAVNLSNRPASDDRWRLISADSGAFYLYNVDHGGFLSQTDREVSLSSDETRAERWYIDPVVE